MPQSKDMDLSEKTPVLKFTTLAQNLSLTLPYSCKLALTHHLTHLFFLDVCSVQLN